jgi:hypothetical protein
LNERRKIEEREVVTGIGITADQSRRNHCTIRC